MTFFGEGVVAHVALADPTCPELSRTLYDAGCGAGVTMHLGGTYLNMEGPQFSTKAESNLYRSWDMDIIGMTNMAEAKLAREAEICYASLACVTDYDCWHMDESTQTVSVEMIVQNLMKNIENSKAILKAVMPKLKAKATCACRSALRDAIITDPGMMPAKTKKKLALIMGKYMR
jgi:5'-methylthioadenosine phosphorylase